MVKANKEQLKRAANRKWLVQQVSIIQLVTTQNQNHFSKMIVHKTVQIIAINFEINLICKIHQTVTLVINSADKADNYQSIKQPTLILAWKSRITIPGYRSGSSTREIKSHYNHKIRLRINNLQSHKPKCQRRHQLKTMFT